MRVIAIKISIGNDDGNIKNGDASFHRTPSQKTTTTTNIYIDECSSSVRCVFIVPVNSAAQLLCNIKFDYMNSIFPSKLFQRILSHLIGGDGDGVCMYVLFIFFIVCGMFY